jgi:hypothetical protein
MKIQLLGMIGVTLAAGGLQAQPTGLGAGGGRGGGAAAGAFIQQFQQAGTMAAVAVGRGMATMANGRSGQTVIGRPVSGTEEQRSKQTLSDGTEIATSESDQFYRDSAGRTRVEMPGRTVIVDPVARVTVTLNANTKTARKMDMPAAPEPRVGVAFQPPQVKTMGSSTYTITVGDGSSTTTVTSSDPVVVARGGRVGRGDAENRQHEDLGVESLNGALASHTRDTLTIPQGQIGNNRDIHVVNERWYSDDLQMLVKTVNSDPRFGENTYELTNISRDEPDASLFQIPSDYKVLGVSSFSAAPVTTVNK